MLLKDRHVRFQIRNRWPEPCRPPNSRPPDSRPSSKCGSRSEIGGSSAVDPQTLDPQNPLLRVLCRQGVILFVVCVLVVSVKVIVLHLVPRFHGVSWNLSFLRLSEFLPALCIFLSVSFFVFFSLSLSLSFNFYSTFLFLQVSHSFFGLP